MSNKKLPKKEIWLYCSWSNIDYHRSKNPKTEYIQKYVYDEKYNEYHIDHSDYLDISNMSSNEEVLMNLAIRGISKVYYHAHSEIQYYHTIFSPRYFKQHYRICTFKS